MQTSNSKNQGQSQTIDPLQTSNSKNRTPLQTSKSKNQGQSQTINPLQTSNSKNRTTINEGESGEVVVMWSADGRVNASGEDGKVRSRSGDEELLGEFWCPLNCSPPTLPERECFRLPPKRTASETGLSSSESESFESPKKKFRRGEKRRKRTASKLELTSSESKSI